MGAILIVAAPTAEDITSAMIEMGQADRAWRDARLRNTPERAQAERRFDTAAARLNAMRDAARRTFAEPRGWKYCGRRSFAHREIYTDFRRRPVAEVLHLYAPTADIARAELEAYAALYRRKIEHLPWSWHNPDSRWSPWVCVSAVITERSGGPLK